MAAKYSVKMYDVDDNLLTEESCLYFKYVKELYTPYVYFEARFLSSVIDVEAFARIEFWIYTRLMHRGVIDSVDIKQKDNMYTITIKSKSFTSLLCQNQPTPGIMTDVNVAALIDTCPDIPYVTCESTSTENYIYIKDGSTIWDAIVNLGYRQKGIYPYIESANKVRISKKNPSRRVSLVESNILEVGECHDYTRLISDVHMQDTEGNYDTYNLEDDDAVSLGIVRHKQIPLDRQFLNEPEGALDYRIGFSKRGFRCRYVRYIGFNYEDLFDYVSYRSFTNRSIHKVDVVYNGTNVITLLGMYNDGFFSN